ncbi:MAG: delta-60 repeat domain-containing protein, partial [Ginsengibacter sp.]
YSADGSLDNTFGENGTLVHYIEQGDTHFTSTVIQDDGKIVAAGSTWNGSNYDFSFVRYNTNGSLDNTFVTAGKQITDFDNTNDVANAMTIQNDGKFLLAGYAGDNFAIARYNTNGSLDNTFGYW